MKVLARLFVAVFVVLTSVAINIIFFHAYREQGWNTDTWQYYTGIAVGVVMGWASGHSIFLLLRELFDPPEFR